MISLLITVLVLATFVVVVNFIGLRIRNKGMRQIAADELENAEQLLVRTNDGRQSSDRQISS